jgi:chitinase
MVNTYSVPASKLAIGAKYSDPANPTFVSAPSVYQSAYDQLNTTYPDIRGAFVWEAIVESGQNWTFADIVGKDIRGLP